MSSINKGPQGEIYLYIRNTRQTTYFNLILRPKTGYRKRCEKSFQITILFPFFRR